METHWNTNFWFNLGLGLRLKMVMSDHVAVLVDPPNTPLRIGVEKL